MPIVEIDNISKSFGANHVLKGVSFAVERGQVIARVGLLVGILVPSAMLHLEMYDGSASGPLTAPESVSARRADGVPFLRRADLMDPTPFLNVWRTRLAGT